MNKIFVKIRLLLNSQQKFLENKGSYDYFHITTYNYTCM